MMLSPRKRKSFCALLVLFFGSVAGACSASRTTYNVVLIVVDALRADHLGCYGYPLPTTPVIDRLARNALIGTNVRSQSNWTAAAMASLMTGTYPSVHKITKSPEDAQDRFSIVPQGLHIISEPFQASGYFTAAVSSCGWVSPSSGYGKGFDVFQLLDRKDEVIIDGAIDLLEKKAAGPFFFYLHLLDTHDYFDLHLEAPAFGTTGFPVSETMRKLAGMPRAEIYNWLGAARSPGDLSPEDIAYFRHRYDAFLNRTDRLIGKLIDRLEKGGRLGKTIVIITADHGESFFEHGRFIHGGDSLYPEVLRVPLIIHNAALFPKAKVFADPAESIDIVPTLLDLVKLQGLGPEGLGQLQGRSLLARPKPRILLSEIPETRKILAEGWSFIRPDPPGEVELYAVASDPGELQNVAAKNPKIVKRMNELLAKKLAESLDLSAKILPEDAPMDENTKKILKSLGYIK